MYFSLSVPIGYDQHLIKWSLQLNLRMVVKHIWRIKWEQSLC